MIDLGIVRPGSTIQVPFATYGKTNGESITLTGLLASDIEVYKDGSVTQRASDAGYTLLDTDGIDFDAITGIHGVSIDLADNTTAGFWAAGSSYVVAIASVTIDGQTVNFIPVTFRIGYLAAVLNTTIATLSSQTSFTLTSGPAEDDALNNMWCLIHDVASAVQFGYAIISDYTGSTKTVTLAAGTTFTVAASDNFSLMGPMPLQPTVAGRSVDVSAGGEAGVDWANVGSPTTAVDLSGTTIKTTQKVDVETIKTNPVVNGGTITFPTGATLASTTNITAGTITTVTNLTNAPTSGDLTATMKASVNTEVDTAIADARLDELLNADSDIDGAAPPTVGSVFHELMSKTAGSFTFDQTTDSNEAIRDNMGTAQTGDAYAIVNSGVHGNAALKTLIDAVDDYIDTEVAAILEDTGTTLDDLIDTEIAAIKAKTDSLTFTVSNQVDANIQSINDTTVLGNGAGTPWGP